ncbi:hypothetical protein [Actinomadura nitritigenes]|uniref:hypothetical protein n=1 Tax=Actinomadura nitritigenes TaxID=134602 RepID=UPI003D89F222
MSIETGALVNVTITGVRMGERSHIRMTVQTQDGEVWVLPPHAEVERIAPRDWPPEPGDIWEAEHGARYFAYRGEGSEMRFMIGSGASWEVGYLHSIYPVRLADRPARPHLLKSEEAGS